jgi:DnaK suppressor protein
MDVDTTFARLEQLEQRLLAERHALVTEVDDAQSESVDELGREAVGWSDSATSTYERELDSGLIDELDDELEQVAQARRRVADGTYGVCDECGEPIADERLCAVPATRWCIAHARENSRIENSLL